MYSGRYFSLETILNFKAVQYERSEKRLKMREKHLLNSVKHYIINYNFQMVRLYIAASKKMPTS